MELDFDNQRLADALCKGNVSLKLAWLVALNRLSSANIPVEQREKICRACPEPRFAIRFASLLNEESPGSEKKAIDSWWAAIENSSHSELEWFQALDKAFAWLEDYGKRAPLSTLTGYIECSTQSNEAATSDLSLPDLVEHFIETYGIQVE